MSNRAQRRAAEAVQAVYKRLGLTLNFGDPENLVDFNDD